MVSTSAGCYSIATGFERGYTDNTLYVNAIEIRLGPAKKDWEKFKLKSTSIISDLKKNEICLMKKGYTHK